MPLEYAIVNSLRQEFIKSFSPLFLSPTLRPEKCTHGFDILFGHEWVQIGPSNIVGGPLQRITFVEAALLGFYLQIEDFN